MPVGAKSRKVPMLRNASAGHGYWMTSAQILREQRTRMLDSAGSRELAGPTELVFDRFGWR